MLVWLTEDFKQ